MSGWGYGLIGVNPGIFLEILWTFTYTPKSGLPVSVLRFETGATECKTRVNITAIFFAAFDNMFVLMLRRNLLPPSSRRLNSVTVVC